MSRTDLTLLLENHLGYGLTNDLSCEYLCFYYPMHKRSFYLRNQLTYDGFNKEILKKLIYSLD
jgi:hypothetical protein